VTGVAKVGEKVRFWVLHQVVPEFNLLTDQKASIAVFLGHSKFAACCIWHSRSYNKYCYWSGEVKRCSEIACRNVTCDTVSTTGCNTARLWPGGLSGAVHRSGGQAVRRRPLTADIPVRSQTSPSETCAENTCLGPSNGLPPSVSCHQHCTAYVPSLIATENVVK
jgi:hypothetical protein